MVSQRRRRPAILVALGLALLFAGLQGLGAFRALDRKLLDWFFLARPDRKASAPIVIVAIDYESLQRLQARWPWPRSVHAQLIRELTVAEASVVAFDVLFTDPDPVHDAELAAAAEEHGNVVWASTFAQAGRGSVRVFEHQTPSPALRVPSSSMGYADLWFDPDGTVRRWSPFRQLGQDVFKGFSLAIAERYRHMPLLHISAGGTRWGTPNGPAVPTADDGSLVINYIGPPESFPTVAYARVLDHTVPLNAFRGKIVLVGSTAVVSDTFFTPHYNRAMPETAKLMPGVEIHANIIDMLLRGGFVHRTGWVVGVIMLALVSVLAAVATAWRRSLLSLGLLTATLATGVTLGYQAFARFDVWIPMAAPLLAAPLTWGALFVLGYVRERREKDFVRSVLDVYVSPTVIDEIVSGGVDLGLGGKRRPLTILFADVRGFTGLSERIAPEPLVSLLGEYFAASTRIILAHGGTLDKFIGDAVMAFWGAPTAYDDYALRAVKTALEMQAAARAIDASAQARLNERFRIGIGINSGDAVVGQIGAPERLSYTAVGDPVNVAARVESLTREKDADILITQSTYELVKFEVQAEPLGFMHVKGRTDPVGLYRVLGLKETPP